MDTTDIKTISKTIERTLNRKISPIQHQLWDQHDIADYFNYSLDYTKRRIMTHINFPPSRPIPIDGKKPAERWRAVDIINFAMAIEKNNLNY